MEASCLIDLPNNAGSLGVYSGQLTGEPRKVDQIVHSCLQLRNQSGKKEGRYVVTFHNSSDAFILEHQDNQRQNVLSYCNFWIWGNEEDRERNTNVSIIPGTGEMVANCRTDTHVRKGSVLYLNAPIGWDWSEYHFMLLCDLVKDVSELLRAYPKLIGKPDCPYGLMRTVLEKISFREVVNHCADSAMDISVDNYVTIRNKGEKAEILRGIRTGMALVK